MTHTEPITAAEFDRRRGVDTPKPRRQARTVDGTLFDPSDPLHCLQAAKRAADATVSQAVRDDSPWKAERYQRLADVLDAVIDELIDYTYRTHVVALVPIPFPITSANRPANR